MSFYGKYSGMGGSGGGGVTSLDGLTGSLTLVAGTGISIVDGVNTITISSTSAGDVTLAPFGSTPNANAASLTGQQLTLQPASGSFPGGVSTLAQTFAGSKTFSNLLNADGGIDRSTAGTLTIGATNSNIINIGNSGATVNIQGTTIYENTPQLLVADPLITINSGGSAGSGQNSGIQIEENAIITGYAETSADRNSWILKAPNTAGIATITPGASGITLNQSSHNPVTIGTANGLSLATQVLSLALSSTSTTGALSSTDWNTFNSKQAALTLTNLTAAGTDGITVTNGTGAVIGASPVTIQQQAATGSVNGYLTSTDWNTFNNKQTAGSYITALTGDGTAAGPGSVAFTLATVNGNVGSFGTASSTSTFTVNAKGLITAASNTAIQIAESQVTNLVSDLAGKQPTGNYITALTGDATAAGPGSVALTLATVNSNVGSFGSSTSIPSFTVNAKGLITAASGNAVIAPAGTLTGTTLASNVVTSSLTSVGTITSGTWNGTAVAIANGGTGQTSKAAAFDALSPMTTSGDLIVGGASGTGTRLDATYGQGGNVPSNLFRNQQFLSQLDGSGTLGWRYMLPPKITKYTSSSGTHLQTFYFILSSNQSVTAGAVYTAPGFTYTVSTTISSQSTLVVTGDGAAGGSTLTKSSGTGPATLTFLGYAQPLYYKIRMVGGGGGGSTSGTAGSTAATPGGNSTFGSSLLTANGGGAGIFAGSANAGGSATINSPAIGSAFTGGVGQMGGTNTTVSAAIVPGGQGGNSPFGGAGSGTWIGAGAAAAANSGSGGGGGMSSSTQADNRGGTGGSAGGYIDAIVTAPSSTYTYAVGAGGSAGLVGTNGSAGGAGGSGYIIVEEHYQ
jgi:hypothetical protein